MNGIIEKLKKLQELSQRGEGGEADNATKMLYRLMEKNGVTIDQISDETPKRQTYNFKGMNLRFVLQVISSEIGNFSYYKKKGKGKVSAISFDCTDSEFLYIKTKVKYYWDLLKEEERLFKQAFIHSNNLYCKDPGDPDRKYTKKELEDFYKIMRMAENIEPKPLNKMLE